MESGLTECMIGGKLSPLFSFGVIADVQYADIDDKMNYAHTKWRYYRNAVHLLREAIASWNKETRGVNFVVQLGDLVDGFNLVEKGKSESFAVLKRLMTEFENCHVPVHNVIGNHDVFNFLRKELFEMNFLSGYVLSRNSGSTINLSPVKNEALFGNSQDSSNKDAKEASFSAFCESLNVPASDFPAFYHFFPQKGFRFIVLDSYDLSVLGYDTDSDKYHKSFKLLRSVNKNEQWNSPQNLKCNQRQFTGFNGGVGEEQLTWLEMQLKEASKEEQRVVIFAHVPILHDVTEGICLAWNHEEVLSLIHKFSCVVAIFCGHTHDYAYATDALGIHHVVFPGIVEVPPGQNGFATIDVYEDHLHVRGVGMMPSLFLNF